MGSTSVRVPARREVAVAVALLALVLAGAARAAQPTQPLYTAIIEPDEIVTPDAALAAQRIRAAGATYLRTSLSWYGTAPVERPASWNPEDPNDPRYNWSAFDAKLRPIVAAGLEPIVAVFDGPTWARLIPGYIRVGANSPVDPTEFAKFMKAAATRYSGRTAGVPRIRYWQVWIEPNLHPFLSPQFDEGTGQPYSPRIYREMVNAVSDALHEVNPDNVVIAGATAPFRDVTDITQRFHRQWGPLTFMREFLCLGRDLQPSCEENMPVRFDVWAHHPYTSGGPTHHANLPDDVSIGDLPEMRAVLQAGVRTGHVRSSGPVRFWVTEFSWDTNPPDPQALPLHLHTRWTAEALYRMWRHGVTLVTWLQIRDAPYPQTFVQSGLWWNGPDSRGPHSIRQDRPKPALTAFRFPVVGFPQRGRTFVWGRTPGSRQATVVVEQSFRGGWKVLGRLRTSRYGVFQATFRSRPTGSVRARTVDRRERSLAFSLKPEPDCFVVAFGTTPGTIEDGAGDPSLDPRHCANRTRPRR